MIIGLSGKIHTGKTTLANLIVTRLQDSRNFRRIPAKRMAFGDKLKEEAAHVYEFPVADAFHSKSNVITLPKLASKFINPEWGEEVSIRQILQFYATEVVRERDPDYWINAIDERIKAIPSKDARIILIDDVRFPNELEYVRKGGVCFRLACYPGWADCGYQSQHPSETALDSGYSFDEILCPDFGQLDECAAKICRRIMKLYGAI